MTSMLLMAAVAVLSGGPELVEVPASRDSTLYQSSTGGVANGSGQHLFAGVTLREGSLRRCVLYFDVASAVPSGARVVSASLRLNVSRTLRDQLSVVTVHEVLRSWSEGPSDAEGDEGIGAPTMSGDSTWIHASFPGERWSSAGGDFGPSLTQTEVLNEGFNTWPSTQAFTELVSAWAGSPEVNVGVLLRGTETTTGNTKRFDSRESENAAVRPVLQVWYRCLADFNEDDFVDFFDYQAFVSCFEGLCEPGLDADANQDGFVDFFDYDRFVTVFETGC